MLTTAAWPAASRNRRPLSSTIQQPSPRIARGNAFLRFRENSPLVGMPCPGKDCSRLACDRKSTRLNSSHSQISYAVFCLKKITTTTHPTTTYCLRPARHRRRNVENNFLTNTKPEALSGFFHVRALYHILACDLNPHPRYQ